MMVSLMKGEGIRRRAGDFDTNTLKDEFNKSFKEMLDSGVPEKQVKKLASKAYKYFNELGFI